MVPRLGARTVCPIYISEDNGFGFITFPWHFQSSDARIDMDTLSEIVGSSSANVKEH